MRIWRERHSDICILLCLYAAFIMGACAEDIYLDSGGEKSWIRMEIPSDADHETWYSLAGAFDGCLIAGSDSGIYRSFTNGDSWERIDKGLKSHAQIMSVIKGGGGLLFAGLHPGGVFVSSDNGANWRQVNNHLTNIYVRSLALNSSGHLFAGTDGGDVFVSFDNGGVWEPCGSDLMNTDVLALGVDSNDVLFAGCYGDGVFKSLDSGRSWAELNAGLRSRKIRDIARGPDFCVFAATDSGGIFRMENGSGTWEEVGSGVTGAHILAITTGPGGAILAGTYGDGVLESRDGGKTWDRIGYGIRGKDVISIICMNDRIFAATRNNGVFRSDDEGSTWLAKGWRRIDDAGHIRIGPGGALIVGSGNGLFVSDDGGAEWIRSDEQIYCHVDGMVVHPEGYVLAVLNYRLYRSDDGCRTWERLYVSVMDDPLLSIVEVDSAGAIYTGNAGEGVFRSTDGGGNWENLYVPLDEDYSFWEMDHITSKPNSTVFVVCDGDIFRSVDYGSMWQKLGEKAYSIDTDSKGFVFISGSECVMRSGDNGTSWECVGSDVIHDRYGDYRSVGITISRNDHVLAWSGDGYLFHSIDGGDSWYEDSYIGNVIRLNAIRDVTFSGAGYAYVLGRSYIYRSAAPDY